MRLITLDGQTDFAGWRAAARRLIADGVAPEDTSWSVGVPDSLFDDDDATPAVPEAAAGSPSRAASSNSAPARSCIATPSASRSSTGCCGGCGASRGWSRSPSIPTSCDSMRW